MAVINLNPIFRSIHGRFGDVVFYFRRGVQCLRSYAVPYNPDTVAQQYMRRSFGGAVRSWQAMSDSERYSFNRKARYLNMSGYNLYISGYIKSGIRKDTSAFAASMRGGTYSMQPGQSRINSVSEPLSLRFRFGTGFIRPHLSPG